jgi:hypothetical protein
VDAFLDAIEEELTARERSTSPAAGTSTNAATAVADRDRGMD